MHATNCKCEVKEYTDETKSLINSLTKSDNHELSELKKEAEEIERKVTVLTGKIIKTDVIETEENYDEELEKIIEDFTKVKQKTEQTYKKYGDEPVIIEIKKTIYEIEKQAEILKEKCALLNKNQIKPISVKLGNQILSSLDKSQFDKTIKYSNFIFPNATNLWDISSSKFQSKSAQKYIMLNGQTVEKVSDLNDRHLENFIRNKLEEQLQTKDARGIFFDDDSSLSKAIIKDENFKNKIKEIVNENKNKLIFKRIADDTSFGGFSNKDLRNALGNIDIIDIYIDNKYNLCALIIDTYDFNKNDDNPIVQKAREYQEANEIENYYLIIPIKIPLNQWKTF